MPSEVKEDVVQLSKELCDEILKRLYELTKDGKPEWICESKDNNVWGVYLDHFGGFQVIFEDKQKVIVKLLIAEENKRILIGQGETTSETCELKNILVTKTAKAYRLLYLLSIVNEVTILPDEEYPVPTGN